MSDNSALVSYLTRAVGEVVNRGSQGNDAGSSGAANNAKSTATPFSHIGALFNRLQADGDAHALFNDFQTKFAVMTRAVFAAYDKLHERVLSFEEFPHFFGQRAMVFEAGDKSSDLYTQGICLGDGRIYTQDCVQKPGGYKDDLWQQYFSFASLIEWTNWYDTNPNSRGPQPDPVITGSGTRQWPRMIFIRQESKFLDSGSITIDASHLLIPGAQNFGYLRVPVKGVDEAIARIMLTYVEKMTTSQVRSMADNLGGQTQNPAYTQDVGSARPTATRPGTALAVSNPR